jgi:hypothetical protein
MEKDAQKMFEMMQKLNPSFKINEDSFNSSFEAQPTSQPTAQPTSQSTSQPTAQSTAQPKPIQQSQFQDLFKTWFATLGYTPTNQDVTINKVVNDVKTALQSLGYE